MNPNNRQHIIQEEIRKNKPTTLHYQIKETIKSINQHLNHLSIEDLKIIERMASMMKQRKS